MVLNQLLKGKLFCNSKKVRFHNSKAMNTTEIVEGSARMQYDANEAVFYNKVQVLNRDISTQVIRLFAERVLEERRKKFEKKLQKSSQGRNQL